MISTECTDCRYTSGHTSWCRKGTGAALVTPAEQAAVAAATHAQRPARRIDLYTATAERVAREVVGSTIRVDLWDGRVVGQVERVENGRTVVRFPDGTWAYGPSGRVTVR